MCQNKATASDFPFHDIFAPTKNSSFKVSDDVTACDLWFTSPHPIKNPGYAYASPEVLAEIKTIFYNAFCLLILQLELSRNTT